MTGPVLQSQGFDGIVRIGNMEITIWKATPVAFGKSKGVTDLGSPS